MAKIAQAKAEVERLREENLKLRALVRKLKAELAKTKE